jgi:CO/xanthine dehydrogenase Mo-binding subunit
MKEYLAVGKRLPRIDGVAKATGEAKYSVDIVLPNMLYGKILRSPYPHARIINIDTSKAERLPGVKAVITAKDTPRIECDPWAVGKYVLAIDKVRCIGDEVAAVAAIDEDTALEALDLIKVEYELLPAVFDPLEALKPEAPRIHDVKGNIARDWNVERGDVDKGFREADCIIEDRFETQFQNHCYMEPIACVADFDISGKLTIWLSSMDTCNMRRGLAKVLNMTESKVRVVQTYVGGAFGSRIDIESIHATCALLARKTGKAVRMENTREEQFMATFRRLNAVIEHKTRIAVCPDAMYRIPNMKAAAKLVYTNKPYVTAFRGFGAIKGTFVLETQLEVIAEKLGIDPMELRLKNATQTDYVSIHGEVISSCALSECIRKAAESIGWREKKKRKKYGRGIGMACSMYMSDARATPGFGGSVAFVKILEDGRVNIISGEHEYGQGMWNVFAQIVAEELGVSVEDIDITTPDTDITPYALGPHGGGRATISAGNAVKLAAEDARKQLFQVAAEMLEANVEDLVIEDQKIYVNGSPEKGISISEVAKTSIYRRGGSAIIGKGVDERDTEMINLDTMYGNYCSAYTFSAQTAEVEIDTKTGRVKVLNYGSANDLGKAINPMAAEGQVEGQVSIGLGYGLMEEMVLEKGKMVNARFLDYKIPTAFEIPPIKAILVESNEPHGPYGAKGVGRLAVIPPASAIANAIYDAIGVRIKELPITPEKILKALKERREGGKR